MRRPVKVIANARCGYEEAIAEAKRRGLDYSHRATSRDGRAPVPERAPEFLDSDACADTGLGKGIRIMARVSKSDQAEAIERLRGLVKPGDTVYTVLRSVSRSGMSRSIDIYKFETDDRTGRPVKVWLSYNVAHAGIGSWDDARKCVKVGGVGMDMGFHLVYSLSSRLFRDGFGCIGEGCPSNDHSNGDRDYTPHSAPRDDTSTPGAAHWHAQGGYALRHEWI